VQSNFKEKGAVEGSLTMEGTPTGALSAADEAAMDRRRKLELWKAQKEAGKAKGQVLHRGAQTPPGAYRAFSSCARDALLD